MQIDKNNLPFNKCTLKYFIDKGYNLINLHTACDISSRSVTEALKILKFNIGEKEPYYLYVSIDDIENAQEFLTDLVPIKLYIDETLNIDN